MNKPLFILIALYALLSSCGINSTWMEKSEREWQRYKIDSGAKVLHSVYLIGDGGKPEKDGKDPVLNLLKKQIYEDSTSLALENRTVVYLGDNIYKEGLSRKNNDKRQEEERRLSTQLDVTKNHPGKKVMIPGNHDWEYMGDDGWEFVVRQQKFVEKYMGDSATYFPKGGCPGPVEISLNDQLTLIAIDSQWWLHKHAKPEGIMSPCDVINKFDFLVQLQNTIRRNKGKDIILAMHHPLYSNSNHGGHYSLKDHLFPLTLRRENLYIPLPIIGSLYPFMRKYGLSPQDIPHPDYQKLKRGIMNILQGEERVIIATGHDHNLQLHKRDEIHHIVSGSACKSNYIVKANKATFVADEKGFVKVNYYDNGEVWSEFWAGDKDDPNGRLLFKKPLYAVQPEENPKIDVSEIPDYTDSTIVLAAGKEYKSKFFLKKWLLGNANREEWATPVSLKYLDMQTEAQGLTPLKRGGGKQTLSLRCAGGDGNQYTLRSVNKNPTAVIPEGLRRTFAQDLVQDQISSAHPYGAIAVPKLANAVDVYHTHPRIRYIPFTPQLGTYLDEFGGMIALMEIRPDENLSEFRNFGKSKNVVSSQTMFGELRSDNDNSVDDEDFLRARYLDMLINDWDRHSDQWRWAEFDKENGGELLRPVPRDRDQVFSKYNGLLPAIAASPFFVRDLSHFGYKIRDVVGLNQAGVHMDRLLLHELEWKDWEKEVKDVQEGLTDEVIEAAIKDMPKEVYDISGEEIIAKLKTRRDDLGKYARKYYEKLAEYVDISLTDKDEYVVVERRENGDVEVKAFKRDIDPGEKDDIEQEIYERDFKKEETREIRIYCLGGKDSVIIKGKTKKSIEVRVIGGFGEDYIEDKSQVWGISNKTKIYDFNDTIETNILVKGKEANIRTSEKAWVNDYNIYDFKYPRAIPLIKIQYDVDYGVYLGAGIEKYRYGFRTSPYKSKIRTTAAYSLLTQAINFDLDANYPVVFGQKAGLNALVDVDAGDFLINYFNQGNETPFSGDGSIDQNRVQLSRYKGHLKYTNRLSEKITFMFGPTYEYATTDSIGAALQANPDDLILEENEFELMGAEMNLNFDLTRGVIMPTRGLTWNNSLGHRLSNNSSKYSYTTYKSDATFYLTPNFPFTLTFALRLGGETSFGDYPFHNSAFLGGATNIRGYRAFRFAGRSAFYQNLEARLHVARFKSYILNGAWGFYGFLDNGRVWADNETSTIWHQGYGAGIWSKIFGIAILSSGIGFSDEGNYIRVNAGFFF